DRRAGAAYHRQGEERGRLGLPGTVGVEQGRSVEPGSGGQLGHRRVLGGGGDAAGTPAIDEFELSVLADGGYRGDASGGQLGQGTAREGPDRGPAQPLPAWRVAEPGDLCFVGHQPDQPVPGPGDDGPGQRGGVGGGAYRRAASPDVDPPA